MIILCNSWVYSLGCRLCTPTLPSSPITLAMIPVSCLLPDDERPGVSRHLRTSGRRLFYYLIAGFMIFVLGWPGHPVGMPFIGVFFVKEEGDGSSARPGKIEGM